MLTFPPGRRRVATFHGNVDSFHTFGVTGLQVQGLQPGQHVVFKSENAGTTSSILVIGINCLIDNLEYIPKLNSVPIIGNGNWNNEIHSFYTPAAPPPLHRV